MAEWTDDFREGSFRGVPFFVDSHEFNFGRRRVEHEFPTKDQGNSEDVGKKLPGYNLNIYVLGDDYFEKRDALTDALEQEGAGILIHPYLGRKSVQVGTVTLSERAQETRIARFSVNFSEAGVDKFPQEEQDIFEQVLDFAESVGDATEEVFDAAFSVINAPARVAQAAESLVSDIADFVDGIAKKIGTSAQAIADVSFAIRNIKSDVSALVSTPDQLASRFRASFGLLFDATSDLKNLSRELSTISQTRFDPIVSPGDTPTTKRLKGNQLALENLMIELSLESQARAAIQGNYISVNEAIDIRDLLLGDIESHLDDVTDDDLFQRLKDLQVSAANGLPPPGVGEIVTFTPKTTLPALVIAYQLFKNIDKADEIVSQNKIRNPGFVEAQTPIEVSSG